MPGPGGACDRPVDLAGSSGSRISKGGANGLWKQMTAFKAGFVIQNFDVSHDGKHIVFDRLRNNSDIVLMNLAR
jgi:hypothetical protein